MKALLNLIHVVMIGLVAVSCSSATTYSRLSDREQEDQIKTKLSSFINDLMEKHKVPGVSVAVLKDRKLLFSAGYGTRDGTAPVDADTLFAIGSISKSFTSAVVGTQVDDGSVKWDEPIREYLPSVRFLNERATEEATFEDLLSHRTGLPRHDLAWYGRDEVSRADLVRNIRHLEPSQPFRAKWQYQNLMLTLAGYISGVVEGSSWERLVQERLFTPLGMPRSNFSVAAMIADSNSALPYSLDGSGAVVQIPHRNIDAVGPAGSINSSANEMAQYIGMLLNKGKSDGNQILSAAALENITSPHMVVRGPQRRPEISYLNYGLAWMIYYYRGHQMVTHGGAIDGYKATASFLPLDGIGIVVLTNAQHKNIGELISFRANDLLLGLDPIDFEKPEPTADQPVPDQPSPPAIPDSPQTQPGRDLGEYAGAYTHPAYGKVVVNVTDSTQLSIKLNSLDPADIAKRNQHDAFYFGEEPTDGVNINKLLFRTDFDGRISGILWPLETGVKPIDFKLE